MKIESEGNASYENILRRQLLSSLAHDLKTPLACVIGALQIVEQMPHTLSDEQHDMLMNTALTEAQRMNEMITEMLTE